MYFNATNKVIIIHKILDLYNLAYSKKRWYTSSNKWFQNKIKKFNLNTEIIELANQFIKHLEQSKFKRINKIVFDEAVSLFEAKIIDDTKLIDILRQWRNDYNTSDEFLNCITKLYDIPVSFGSKRID